MTETPLFANKIKLPDAAQRLHEVIESAKKVKGFSLNPDDPDTLDCVRLADNAVKAQLDVEVLKLEGILYSPTESPDRWASGLMKKGYRVFWEVMRKYFLEVSPIFAQKGDIAVFDEDPLQKNPFKRWALGIVLENGYTLVMNHSEEAVTGFKTTLNAVTCFRIGA